MLKPNPWLDDVQRKVPGHKSVNESGPLIITALMTKGWNASFLPFRIQQYGNSLPPRRGLSSELDCVDTLV